MVYLEGASIVKNGSEGFDFGPAKASSQVSEEQEGFADTRQDESWQSKLTGFTDRFNTLNQQSQNVSGDALTALKDKYVTLHDDISTTLEGNSTQTDLSGTLARTGILQTQIKTLEKRKKELKVEVDTALARDELLRSRDTKVTTKQLLLLDRPVRKAMIPYLWVLAVFFIGVGLVCYKMMLPSLGPVPSITTVGAVDMNLTELLFNKTVLISLASCTIFVLIVVGLKAGGMIGKN